MFFYNLFMKLKISTNTSKGIKRSEGDFEINDILIKENIFEPEKEMISLEITTQRSNGILEFTKQEFEKLMKSMKGKTKLIKKYKRIKKSK